MKAQYTNNGSDTRKGRDFEIRMIDNELYIVHDLPILSIGISFNFSDTNNEQI